MLAHLRRQPHDQPTNRHEDGSDQRLDESSEHDDDGFDYHHLWVSTSPVMWNYDPTLEEAAGRVTAAGSGSPRP
jgi:hypothetical protein